LEVVPKLAAALKGCKNTLFHAALQNLQNPTLDYIKSEIFRMIKEDTLRCKSVMQMRTQQAFAIKVCIPIKSMSTLTPLANSQGSMVLIMQLIQQLIRSRFA